MERKINRGGYKRFGGVFIINEGPVYEYPVITVDTFHRDYKNREERIFFLENLIYELNKSHCEKVIVGKRIYNLKNEEDLKEFKLKLGGRA